jgi:fatty-acid desaturase
MKLILVQDKRIKKRRVKYNKLLKEGFQRIVWKKLIKIYLILCIFLPALVGYSALLDDRKFFCTDTIIMVVCTHIFLAFCFNKSIIENIPKGILEKPITDEELRKDKVIERKKKLRKLNH